MYSSLKNSSVFVNNELRKMKTAFLCHGGLVCQGKKMPENMQDHDTKQEKK